MLVGQGLARVRAIHGISGLRQWIECSDQAISGMPSHPVTFQATNCGPRSLLHEASAYDYVTHIVATLGHPPLHFANGEIATTRAIHISKPFSHIEKGAIGVRQLDALEVAYLREPHND